MIGVTCASSPAVPGAPSPGKCHRVHASFDLLRCKVEKEPVGLGVPVGRAPLPLFACNCWGRGHGGLSGGSMK